MSILVVDAHNFMWRSVYSAGEQHVASTFISYLNDMIDKFVPSSIVLCWDAGKPRYRSELYPEYKAQRKDAKAKVDMEEIAKQADFLRRYLEYKGIQQIMVDGVEADDVISWISEYAAQYLDEHVYILSTDRDLWQIVTDNVYIFDPIRRVKHTPASIIGVSGMNPALVPEYKAIVGDASDNIKGVKGLGEKYAKKLFDEYGDLAGMYRLENVKNIAKSKRSIKLYTHEDDLYRDLLLTRIPKLKDMPYYLTDTERESFVKCLNNYPQIDEAKARLVGEAINSSLHVEEPLNHLNFSKMPVYPPQAPQMGSWVELDTSIQSCYSCALRQSSNGFTPVLGEGYNNAKIMVVGRNPDALDVSGGKPFGNASRDLIDELLDYCDIKPEQVYFTNVCKCSSDGNRYLELDEIACCSRYLQTEINLLQPKFIIALGSEAMALLTNYKHGVTAHSGEILKCATAFIRHNAWVALAVHPDSALRHSKAKTNFEYAMKNIKNFLDKRRG